MDYLNEIKSLVEIFRDLGFTAEYYFSKIDSRHCIEIKHDTLIETFLILYRYDLKSLFEGILRFTSGVTYFRINPGGKKKEVFFEFPMYSSASELRMKIELKGE